MRASWAPIMQLRNLISEEAIFDARFAAREIAGVTADSRSVKRGDLFVAVSGTRADGLAFVPQALAAGAIAIVSERPPASLPADVAFVKVADARRALALAAARF